MRMLIMTRKIFALALAAVLSAPSVGAHDDVDVHAKAIAPADIGAKHFGDAIPADAQSSTLVAAVAGHQKDAGDQLISGRVAQVCQKAGCWMTLSDGDVMARVMTDHKFALPKDLSGDVVVFGKLEVLDLDDKEIAHMAKDSGKPVSEIAAREYRIAARGVALR